MIDLTTINNSELRLIIERERGVKNLSPWAERDDLLATLQDGAESPKNPLNDLRWFQVGRILDVYKTVSNLGTLPCDGNCFNHSDVQVLDCQIQNAIIQHPTVQRSLESGRDDQ